MSTTVLGVHSVARRVNAERILILSWPRAILLQLAHPLVAAGVSAHSSFRDGPVTAARRLHETVRSMLSLTFGSPDEHRQTIERILAIHRRVNGVLEEAVGVFPAGTRYSAEDPALVLWVHATLIESVVDLYGRVREPMSDDERDAYCGEAAEVAVALGADPAEVPVTWAALQAYLVATYASGRIAVGNEARAVARAVIRPPMSWSIWPLARLNRTVTLGLLPADIRAEYGYGWTPRDDRKLARHLGRLAAWRRRAPAVVALWPEARRAQRDRRTGAS